MAVVARVDGIKIQFYHDEHPPTYFHAQFAEHEAMIGIDTLQVLKGYLPRPQLRKVVAWARPRKPLLLEAWRACLADRNPGKIP
jgi:Domain of unknown function (DUF4160)